MGTVLPQGSALLPLLFVMFVDRIQPVQVSVQVCDITVASLLFWDDVVLLASLMRAPGCGLELS